MKRKKRKAAGPPEAPAERASLLAAVPAVPVRLLSALLAAILILISVFRPALAAAEEETAYIVKFKASALEPGESGGGAPYRVVSLEEALRLDRAGLLEWYEPDGDAYLPDPEPPVRLLEEAPALYAGVQWNLDLIGAEPAFRAERLGQGVRVGVVDSGVNPHPDLADRLLPGHNYIANTADPEDTADNYGHGTRVAGLIAAVSGEGYIGCAPGAELVPLKVTDGKSVKISAICAAIYGAIDDYGCTVLNLSMGVSRDYESLREAVAYAEEKGVAVVAAVGNGGSSVVYYPAGYDTVIGVGAVDRDRVLYPRSNCNESVFLTAPGVDVRCPSGLEGYTESTGTSFSVPQVTGAVAVLQGMDGELTPGEIRELLAETAADLGAEGYDESYGYGLLDLGRCAAALAERPPRERCSFLGSDGPAEAVRNNTDEDVECAYLMARYDLDGLFLGVELRCFTIPAGETAELEAPEAEGLLMQFLCDPVTLAPITGARRTDFSPDPGGE